MGTSAPVRKEYDIPIVEPYRPSVGPELLPEPDPERIVAPFVPFVPVKQPVRQPVEVRW